MTQNEIITAFVRKSQAARATWEANKTDENLEQWDRWIEAVSCLSEVLEEAKPKPNLTAQIMKDNPPPPWPSHLIPKEDGTPTE